MRHPKLNLKTMKASRWIKGFALAVLLASCTQSPGNNKLYVLSKSTQQLHVFNAQTLFSVLAQPLSFSGVGSPVGMVHNPEFKQLYVNLDGSNTLIRIGTEPPYSYQPLSFTTFGSTSEAIVATAAIPSQHFSIVLTNASIFRMDAFGKQKSGNGSSPTPTPTPSPSPSSTPPGFTAPPGGFTSLTTSGGSVSLPTGCNPSAIAVNMSIRIVGNYPDDTTNNSSSSSSSSNSSDEGSEGFEMVNGEDTGVKGFFDSFLTGVSKTKFEGGQTAAVACRGSNQVAFYDTKSLTLIGSVSLSSGASPTHVLFVRNPGESGNTVTGAFAVINSNNTFEIFDSTSFTRIGGSPFTLGGSVTAFAVNPEFGEGVFMLGYTTGAGAFVDVHDRTGAALAGSPFQLSSDCATSGPGGLHGDMQRFDLSQDQIDAGFSDRDLTIFYSCPDTGLVAALSTNLNVTYLTRNLGAGTLPGRMIHNPTFDVLYVALNGTTSPAPGVIGLSRIHLGNAFEPAAVSFATGSPDQLLIQP